MVHEHGVLAILGVSLKLAILFIIPFVEPQLAGILGGIAYLVVRHELKMVVLSAKSVIIVIFFGWLGAWATVNILAEHWAECSHTWEHIISATVGFLSYDAMMMFGANTKSVIGFFRDIGKAVIEKGFKKWNS